MAMVTKVYTVTIFIVATTVKRMCMKMSHVTLSTQVMYTVTVAFKMNTFTVIGLMNTITMTSTYAYGILLAMVVEDIMMLQKVVMGIHGVNVRVSTGILMR
jgi:hypothetical protein